MTLHASRLGTVAAATALIAAATALQPSAATPKFFDDDPIAVDRATEDAAQVKPTEIKLFVDLTSNIARGFSLPAPGRAANVNTVDEVPDSTWYTNRLGDGPEAARGRALTPRDIATGPDTTRGPAPGRWMVTSSKSDGVTPGFTITDAHGDRWFLKFDPPGYRGMATGTEVAVTKLMWALGYNVPENHIASLRREQLEVAADAKFTPPGGTKRALRAADIDRLLQKADREPDGSYRIVASKALAGKPVGRIRFLGVRPDDPNDIVPHEDRRELRGYGVFAAWLNHVDAKAINSLDTLVTEDGHSYVRHNLIDFGSALGSGGIGPAEYSAGREYLVEPKMAGKQLVGFGLAPSAWHTEAFYESRAIGRLPADNSGFNPESWRPRVPNQAFLHARADDKFWAARKLVAMRTELIAAAVRSGEFGDPQSETFLVRALAQRRDAIAKAYLTAVNPIADPIIAGGVLTFANVAVDADVARAPQAYHAVWSTFDNATHATRRIADTSSRTTSMGLPQGLPTADGAFIQVAMSATDGGQPAWGIPVQAYFRLRNGAWRLVGFERMPAL
jgi:hypothetical protein